MTDQTIDRTKLPIRRAPFQGVTGRTLEGSQPDWNSVAPIPAPEDAPNVLLVLIDDAGFGNPSGFGGPIRTPNLERLAEGGLKYNRFHVTALCSPTRGADDGAQPSFRRLRDGERVRGTVPGLLGDAAKGLRAVPQDAARQRLLDRVFRQMAPDARPYAGAGGPVRPLADTLSALTISGVFSAARAASSIRY